MLNTLAGMVYSARGIDKASRVEVVSPGQQWSKATFVLRVYIILYIYILLRVCRAFYTSGFRRFCIKWV